MEIVMDDLREFRMCYACRFPVYDQYLFDGGLAETDEQHSFANHTCGAGDDDF